MNLDDIQSGSLCVADTNVLLYAERGASRQSKRLLRRCADGELIIALPQTVWHELAHKLMLAEALANGSISGPNPARKLARRPDVVKHLGLYREKISALLDIGLRFEACTMSDFFEASFAHHKRYGLLMNDSLILATALRLKADALATADAAFRDVVGIQVAMPSDIEP
jgi:predicted nucleic acid-binding protein